MRSIEIILIKKLSLIFKIEFFKCGVECLKTNLKQHFKSKKHQEFLKK